MDECAVEGGKEGNGTIEEEEGNEGADRGCSGWMDAWVTRPSPAANPFARGIEEAKSEQFPIRNKMWKTNFLHYI